MDRRQFSKLGLFGLVSLGAGGGLMLSGCSSKLADTSSLSDKSSKSSKDKSSIADEPTVSMRFLACDTFKLALPALQESYSGLHGNVVFGEPTFFPSTQVADHMTDPQFDGMFVDLESILSAAYAGGVTDKTLVHTLYTSALTVVTSPDVSKISSLDDVVADSIENIYIGAPNMVFSGAFANQSLNSMGLYSTADGTTGTYDASISGRVKNPATITELMEAVAGGKQSVGFILEAEALVIGAKPVFEVPRIKHRNVFFTGAAFTGAANLAYAMDFLTYCENETEAEKVADTYGMWV